MEMSERKESPTTGVEVTDLRSALIGDWMLVAVTKTWTSLEFRVEATDTKIGFNTEPVQGDIVVIAIPTKENPTPLTDEEREGILTLEEFEYAMKQLISAQTRLQKFKRQSLEGDF